MAGGLGIAARGYALMAGSVLAGGLALLAVARSASAAPPPGGDHFYVLFAVALFPIGIFFVALNWLGFKYFSHN